MSFPEDRLVLTPDDIDLSKSPLAGDHFTVANGEADLACRITHVPKEAFVPSKG